MLASFGSAPSISAERRDQMKLRIQNVSLMGLQPGTPKVHSSSPSSPSIGPRSFAERSRKGLFEKRFPFFFLRMRLKKHSEKTEDARPKREQRKREKARERASIGTQGKTQPSPASSRNANSLASHEHANLWPNFRRGRRSFRGREG